LAGNNTPTLKKARHWRRAIFLSDDLLENGLLPRWRFRVSVVRRHFDEQPIGQNKRKLKKKMVDAFDEFMKQGQLANAFKVSCI